MAKIDLSNEEVKQIIMLMNSSSVQIGQAENAIKLLNKFKEAEKENDKDTNIQPD